MSDDLRTRLARVGQSLGERESTHSDAMAAASAKAEDLHKTVSAALDGFRESVVAAGAAHLADVVVSAPRLDEKHVRAVEFDVVRGRYRAIVTVKSRGDVTLVGPFRVGKTEGPCKSFPFDAVSDIDAALGDFLEQFLEDATTP